ncbi:general stress protein [Bacillus sp. AGMB 02131]|uniref:General stress protein n=1 Tax=Peribacillus faecalis TaxID=2772559 RepID=A0A927CUP7_9BACI|nr:general stress protein [Peribacillus faecalis]MBD3107908.1 general stress protein [Peribacillus faecalis]
MKAQLEKRFKYLFSGEGVALISFIPLGYLIDHTYPNLQLYGLFSFWISFFLLEFILLQGVIYWYIKWSRLRKENRLSTPVVVIKWFRRLQKVNVLLLVIGLLSFVIDFYKWRPAIPEGGFSLSIFIYVFAVLEYINYYHIQLSYDNRSDIQHLLKTKRLKEAAIRKDLRRLENANQ